jgi:hypothetical protein
MKIIEYNHRPALNDSHNGRHRLSLALGPFRCGLAWITGQYKTDGFVVNRPNHCAGFTLWIYRFGFGWRWERDMGDYRNMPFSA